MDNETQNEEMFIENEQAEEIELDLEQEEEEKITMSKSEWEKAQQTLGALKREVKNFRKAESKSVSNDANELNDAQLNYLDVKGVYEAEDIKIVETFVQKTGKTVREALRDDYVTSKLQSNKTAREVQEAMPSGSKRGGNSGNDIASAIAKFESTGVLPTDFATRSAVVNAIESKGRNNRPNWQL